MSIPIFYLLPNDHLLKQKALEDQVFEIVFLQKFLEVKIIQPHLIFNDRGPSIAERNIRTIRFLLSKLMFLKGNADWLSVLQSVIRKDNNYHHNSIEMNPFLASEKNSGKTSF